jgi:hypothetical protein
VTGVLAIATGAELKPNDVEPRRLKLKVDLPALIARGWDPETRVFAPPADDPLFGYHRCERVRCPRAGESRRARELGLCEACARNFLLRVAKTEHGGEPETLEAFKIRPLRRHAQAQKEALCLICRTPGHERGARTLGLCVDCDRHRRARRQTVEAFVAGHPRLGVPKPRPSFGRCLVDVSALGYQRSRVLPCLPSALAEHPDGESPFGAGAVSRGWSLAAAA